MNHIPDDNTLAMAQLSIILVPNTATHLRFIAWRLHHDTSVIEFTNPYC